MRSKCILQKKRQNRGLCKQEKRVHLPNIYAISWTWSLGLIEKYLELAKLFLQILHPNALWCAIMIYHPALESFLKIISYQICILFREGFQFYKNIPRLHNIFSMNPEGEDAIRTHLRRSYKHIYNSPFIVFFGWRFFALATFALAIFITKWWYLIMWWIILEMIKPEIINWRTFGIEEKSLSGNFASGKCIPCADLWNDHKDDN